MLHAAAVGSGLVAVFALTLSVVFAPWIWVLRSLDSFFVCVGFRGPYAASDGSGLAVGFALAHLFLLHLGSPVSSGFCRSSEVFQSSVCTATNKNSIY